MTGRPPLLNPESGRSSEPSPRGKVLRNEDPGDPSLATHHLNCFTGRPTGELARSLRAFLAENVDGVFRFAFEGVAVGIARVQHVPVACVLLGPKKKKREPTTCRCSKLPVHAPKHSRSFSRPAV